MSNSLGERDYDGNVLWSLGKILQDDRTVESYNIEEKGFVVCMVSKVISPIQYRLLDGN